MGFLWEFSEHDKNIELKRIKYRIDLIEIAMSRGNVFRLQFKGLS